MRATALFVLLASFTGSALANSGSTPPLASDCIGKDQDPLYVQTGPPPVLWVCNQSTGWVSLDQIIPVAGLPAGVIVMWSGSLASIPSGWALCDGAGGRPDLRDKFVKGAAAGQNPGATGGAATHGHTYSDNLQHTHAVNVSDPGHTHLTQRYPTATGAQSGFTIDTSMSGTLADNTQPDKVNTTGITATTSNPAGSVATGNTQTASSEPPFYAVAFIVKL